MNTVFASSDTLYGVRYNITETTAKLYSINPNSGATTLINTLSLPVSKHWLKNVEIDEVNDILYMAYTSNTSPYNNVNKYNLSDGSFIESISLSNFTGSLQSLDYYNIVVPPNHAPTDITLSVNSIAEDQPSGSTVGTLSAVDIDSADDHTFSLGCVGTDNGSFTVSGNSLKTATALDYNTKPSYSICIQTNDGALDYNKTFTINIMKVNNAPTSANASFTINEDENKTFASSDFTFNDSDGGDVLTSIKITTLSTAGMLQLNGVNVTQNQVIPTANISQLKFIPASNAFATSYATFGFSVNDATEDSIAYTATINVNSVDDAPVLSALSNVAKEINFDTFYVKPTATDVENDSITYTATSSNTALATVSLVNDYVQIVSQAYASGSTTITVTATANGLDDSKSFTLSVTAPSAISDVTAPLFSAALSPTTIAPGATSTLTFTINNSSGDSKFEDMGFLTTLPSGITIEGDSASTTCSNAQVTATAGGTTLLMQNARLGVSESCVMSVNITGTTGGSHTITSGNLITDLGSVTATSVTLTIDSTLPKFTKSFSPSTINVDDITRLTYTIDNSLNDQNLTELKFNDTLPTGLTVARFSNALTTCEDSISYPYAFAPTYQVVTPATVTAESLSSDISALGLAVNAGATCSVSVDVVANAPGSYRSVSGELTQNGSNPSGSATAYLTVDQPVVGQTFLKKTVAPGDNTTLRFTITNDNRDNSLTNLSFTEDLNAALSGLSATSLPASGFCGAGSAITGTSNLTISNLSVSAESSCSFDVNVSIPSNATSGDYNVSSSSISATLGLNNTSFAASSTILRVAYLPRLTREIVENPAAPGDDVTLRYTIANTDSVNAMTDISLQDIINNDIAGMLIKTLPPANSCGSVSSFSQAVSSDTISTSIINASLAADTNCTFDFVLTVPSNALGDSYPIGTNDITGTIAGSKLSNTTESAILEVLPAPQLTMSILEDSTAPGSSVTMQFNLRHVANASSDVTGIGFSVDLDGALAGMVVTSGPQNNICGSGSSLSGTSTLSFSGGTLSAGEECDFNATVQIPSSAAPATITVSTSTIAGTVESVSLSSASASDTFLISGLTLTHSFVAQPVFPGENATIRYTLTNSASSPVATAIAFSHSLSGVITSMSAGSLPISPCNGSSALSGTTTLILSGGELQPGTECTFDVPVTIPSAAPFGEHVSVTSNVSATVNATNTSNPASTEYIEIPEYFSVVTDFNETTARSDENVTMRITLTNNHPQNSLTNISFSSDLNATLDGLISNKVVSNGCAGSITLGSTTSLSNGALDANSSCVIELGLQIPSISTVTTMRNSAISVTGTISSTSVTQSSVANSDALSLYPNNISLTKTYLKYGSVGRSVLVNYKLENSGDSAVEGISFIDDLNSTINGMAAIGLPQSNLCGDGSTLSGTSIINLSNGSIAANSSCEFNVSISIPSSASQGLYENNTSDVYVNGSKLATATSATLQVGNIGDFSKSFSPATISSTEVSTLTYTIDNTANDYNVISLAFTDTLPSGLFVAAVPNISNNCTGGTFTAIAGSSSIIYSGASILAGDTCSISVDINSTSVGDYVSSSSVLSSSYANSTTADANLSVDNLSKLTTLGNQTIDEDSGEHNITFNTNYRADDGIAYSIASADNSLITASVVSGTVVINTVPNANGSTSIEVNATANGKEVSQTFNVTVNAVNDAPELSFIDMNLTINEGALTRIPLDNNISDTEGDTLSITPTSSDTNITEVVMDGNVLVIKPLEYKSGEVTISLILSDNNLTDSANINLIITPVDNQPQTDNNNSENDDTFKQIPEATGVKPNFVSANEYKEIVVNGVTYVVYSDADEAGKLSIMRKVDADNWEYVTGYQGFSVAIATTINVKYNKRRKELSISFNDGASPVLEVIKAGAL